MIRAATDSPASQGVLHELAPDLTPLLDIVFILLVFFMLSAGVVLQSVDIKLPAGVAEALSPLPATPHVVLEIQPHNYVLGGQNILQFNALKEAVKTVVAAQPEREFIIAGDREIPVARLLKVLTYLQSQGIVSANILMEEENN